MKKQHAVVTGGAQGIGLEIVKQLCKDGCEVSILDNNEERLKTETINLQKQGYQAHSYVTDVKETTQLEKSLSEAKERAGDISILINNAGWGGPFHLITEVTEDEWYQITDTNLKSVFIASKFVIPDMADKKFGKIINISSIQGLHGAKRSSSYSVAKHGVIAYTKCIASEWGGQGIRSYAVCPGYIDTNMGVQTEHSKNHREKILNITPNNKIGTPEEVANLVTYLALNAPDYLNGSIFTIDGGITCQVQL